MLKSIVITSSVLVALLLSGCGSKPKVAMQNYGSDSLRADISISNGAGVPSWSANESEAFENALETAAATTLQKGYRYFAIIEPKEISNFNGSLLNTPEEILTKCSSSSFLAISIPGTGGLHKCGTYNTNAKMSIVMFKEEQKDFTVFNAQDVIDFMKKENLFENLEPVVSEGK